MDDLSNLDVVPTCFDIVSSADLNGEQQKEMFLDILTQVKMKYPLSKIEDEMFDAQAVLLGQMFKDAQSLPQVEAQARIITRVFTDMIPDRLKEIRSAPMQDGLANQIEEDVFERMKSLFLGIVDEEVVSFSRRYWTWSLLEEEQQSSSMSPLVYRVNVLFQELDPDLEKANVLREQWKGNIVVIKVPTDLTAESVKEMKGFLPYDHPFRQEVRAAILSGHVIELDLSSLVNHEARFLIVRLVHQTIARVFQDTLSSDYRLDIDAKFVLEELLSNALVHGNSLKLHIPIFFFLQTLPNRRDVYLMEVYDVKSEANQSLQLLEEAKQAHITGQREGLFIASFRWEVWRTPVEGGSVAKAYPFSVDRRAIRDKSNEVAKVNNFGGIDMSVRTLDFEILKQGGELPVVMDEDLLESIFERASFDGLSPRILGIVHKVGARFSKPGVVPTFSPHFYALALNGVKASILRNFSISHQDCSPFRVEQSFYKEVSCKIGSCPFFL